MIYRISSIYALCVQVHMQLPMSSINLFATGASIFLHRCSIRLRTAKPTESLQNDSLSFNPVASCTRLTSPSIPTSTFSRPIPRAGTL